MDINAKTGMTKEKLKEMGYVLFENGEAHLQNEIAKEECYICNEVASDDMVLLNVKEKQLGYVCLDHPGVVQEFLRQFRRPPLGWEYSGGNHGHKHAVRDHNG